MKMCKKTALLAILVLLSPIFLSVTNVQAKAVKTPLSFSFSIHFVGGHPEEETWISNGILHARNYYHEGEVKEGFSGTLTYLGNLNAEIDDFGEIVRGNGWGKLTVQGEGGKNFEGILDLKIRDYNFVYGKFTCYGSGEFDGMVIKGIFTLNLLTGFFDADGEIIDPHGG